MLHHVALSNTHVYKLLHAKCFSNIMSSMHGSVLQLLYETQNPVVGARRSEPHTSDVKRDFI